MPEVSINSDLPWELTRYQLEWNLGSRVKAIEFAREHIAQNLQAMMQDLGGKSTEELVDMIDQHRAAGPDHAADVVLIDMWLQSGYANMRVVQGLAMLPAKDPGEIVETFGLLDVASDNRVGRDERIEAATKFIDLARPEFESALGGYTLEECVALVDRYRAEGKDRARRVVEAWLMSEYGPQEIRGSFDASNQFLNRFNKR